MRTIFAAIVTIAFCVGIWFTCWVIMLIITEGMDKNFAISFLRGAPGGFVVGVVVNSIYKKLKEM